MIHCGVQRVSAPVIRAELMQDHRPLRREAHLGHGCDGAADDQLEASVEQANPLNIRRAVGRPEGAAET